MKRRQYPDDPWFYATFEAADLSVAQRFDLLDQTIDMAEENWYARERRLAGVATLKVAWQPD